MWPGRKAAAEVAKDARPTAADTRPCFMVKVLGEGGRVKVETDAKKINGGRRLSLEESSFSPGDGAGYLSQQPKRRTLSLPR